ncbi:hypothetical protein ACIHQR_30260 [Corallococcus coralloides]|uniref:hypothetical protein n=1 Tax=Corallococcus coralloides TaxID=184914 RepID=UPI00384DEF08
MSENRLRALVEELRREFLRQHAAVKRRVVDRRVQELPYLVDDVKRMVELNDIINPLERIRKAFKDSEVPNPEDVEKLFQNLDNEVEKLKCAIDDLPGDGEV